MSIHIRHGRPEDGPFVVEANCRLALETENLVLDRPTVEQGVRAVLGDSSKGLYFIAEIEGRPVGQLMITYEWSDWRNANLWWIQSVYVIEPFRRRGVFTALYRHVQDLSRSSQGAGLRLYVEKHNAAAQQTYRRMGMAVSHYLVMEEILKSD